MDLNERRIRKTSSTLVGSPVGGNVAAFCVGGKIVDVAVSTAGQNNCVGSVASDFSRLKITDDDAASSTIDDD